ncbi:TetR/AcrR family transcriptional regulator [Amycolatopsis nigrescens]|uniref:TetR/AcrR family transcriptional regulator n=1 Tax=Amycolatopsis nigrescens TaxID=381445 RepID=UPI0003AAC0A2|nr:TetR/AcrR family transcriptional regulator [Amycolatopsis nigrescens]
MLDAAKDTTGADGRATRWDAHKAQRRLEVLDAAVAAIEQDGPGVGVKQIAERVGVPRPVVYRHFKDREDLDEQIRQRVVEMLMAELAPTLAPGGTTSQTIRRAVDTYLGWIERHPRLHHFLGAGSNRERGTASRVVSGTKTAIAIRLTELFADALRRFDRNTAFAEPLAFGLVGLVDATVNRWLADPDKTLTSAQLADFLSGSAWFLIEGNLAVVGVHVDPETPLSELLGE